MFRNSKHMGSWLAIAVAVGLLCCSAALAGKPPAPVYTIVPFHSPSPPSDYSSSGSMVMGLNEQGHVVGGEEFQKLVDGNYQWAHQALHLDMATGICTVLRDGYGASGVNNLNRIAGVSLSDDGPMGAFWPSPAADPVDLPPLDGDTQSYASAINDAGIVAGFSRNGDGGLASAVVWSVTVAGDVVSVNGPWTLPPLAGEAQGSAVGMSEVVNGICRVTGYSFLEDGGLYQAVVWAVGVGGTSVTPGPAVSLVSNHAWSVAYGVNDSGAVCGTLGVANQEMPFLAPAGQTAQRLPVPRNTQWGRAYDINNFGEIVGQLDIYKTTGFVNGPGNYHPYLWKNGKMTDLETQISPNSGWARLWGAHVINEAGIIGGYGRFDIERRGFLLIPIPPNR